MCMKHTHFIHNAPCPGKTSFHRCQHFIIGATRKTLQISGSATICVNFLFLHLGGRIFYLRRSHRIRKGHVNTTAGTWYFVGTNGYTYRATLNGWNMVDGTATASSVYNVWANYSENQQQKRPIV